MLDARRPGISRSTTLVKLGNIKEKMKYDEIVLADVVAEADKEEVSMQRR